ncbi:MAG: helix-turn-helix transcriptional regulator [Labilithrix sp.]|nr:helix-turn-helix transcriptional regulator [Labilithrix sp.]
MKGSGYGQFCPVAQALEVFGERWTLLVIRELLERSRRFSDIQRGVPLMSRSMLAQRLSSLCDAGLVERTGDGYQLTDAGKELLPVVMECGKWGARWARRKLKNADVDVGLLMWDMRRRIDTSSIPDEPVLVEMEFRGAPRGKERFFLQFKAAEVELCLTNPGQEVSLRLSTTPKTMAEVWLGDLPFAVALQSGAIRLEGSSKLARAFPSWLSLSRFAEMPRPQARRGS